MRGVSPTSRVRRCSCRSAPIRRRPFPIHQMRTRPLCPVQHRLSVTDEELIDQRIHVGSGPRSADSCRFRASAGATAGFCTSHKARRPKGYTFASAECALEWRKSPPTSCTTNSAFRSCINVSGTPLRRRPRPQSGGHGSALYELALNGGRRNVSGA